MLSAAAEGRRKQRRHRETIWPYVFAAPFVLFYATFQFFPLAYSFILSLYDWNGIGTKSFVAFRNYSELLSDILFRKAVGNTILFMAMTIPVLLAGGVLLAHAVFNAKRSGSIYRTINFLPYITTPVAIGFIFSFLFDWQSGTVNRLLLAVGALKEGYYWLQEPWSARWIVALVVLWRNLGYCMAIYLAGMTALPLEVYEAAKMDGASSARILFKITLPLLKNVTTFLLITSIIGGFQLFDEPKLLYGGWSGSVQVGGPRNAALTVIWKFVDDCFISNSRLGYGAAISYALFALILAFSLAARRLFGLKGDQP